MEGSSTDPSLEWKPPTADTGLEEPMRRLRFSGDAGGQRYPERPDEPNCAFYMRTGFCGYGANCRFNHPRDANVPIAVLRSGDYPEREGEPVCQFYMKTGTCKFGATCKYHHPRHGSTSTVPVNYFGYPHRPGEKECNYYMKTGTCKFGITCKFHHPQPAGSSLPGPVPLFYPTTQSPSFPSPNPYNGSGRPSLQVARSPVLQSSYLQGTYPPLLWRPRLVPFTNWSNYPSMLSTLGSPSLQHPTGAASIYAASYQLSPSAPAYHRAFPSSSSISESSSSGQKGNMFPERPGQPECQFYIKTGDCKFGPDCKYHHPQDRVVPNTDYVLSSMGLPLRPAAPTCTLYAQNGVCMFGPTCKFNHPMGSINYGLLPSSLSVMPISPYPFGSSMGTLAPTSSSSELQAEPATVFRRDSSSGREAHNAGSSEAK